MYISHGLGILGIIHGLGILGIIYGFGILGIIYGLGVLRFFVKPSFERQKYTHVYYKWVYLKQS